MRFRTTLYMHVALAATMALAGCAGGKPGGEVAEGVPRIIERTREQRSDWPRPARRVSVPASAPWLADVIEARYGEIGARQALGVVVPNGLLMYDFAEAGDGPRVKGPVGPASRSEHLDVICAGANWAWSVMDGVVVVSRYATRTWDLASLPGQSTGRVDTSQLDSGAGEQPAEQLATAYPHAEMLAALQEIAGADSSAKVSLLSGTGQIVATGRPSMLGTMAAVIAAHNEASSRRVAIEFALYEVDVSDRRERQLDLDAMREAALALGLDVTVGTQTLSNTTGALTLTQRDGRAAGSSVVLRWLATQGDTQVVLRKTIVASHNQVVAIRDTQALRYVGSVTIQQQVSGPTGTLSPTVEVEELDTGETWSALASIREGMVTLRLATERAELRGFTDYDFAGIVQGTLPQTAVKSMSAPVSLRDGETRVITDLSSSRDKDTRTRSPLLAWLPWLGEAARNRASGWRR